MNIQTLILFTILLGYLRVQAAICNATHLYSLSGSCYLQCPWTPTQYYSYTPDYTCRTTCPSNTYAFVGNRSCVQTCPTTPNITYYDITNKKCVSVCPANTYAATNQSCLSSCPAGSWGNQELHICVLTCPTDNFYANVSIPLCVTQCPSNHYAYQIDRNCYIGGQCPISPVRYYSDDTTGKCVTNCSAGYFADSNSGRCSIYCLTNGFYADSTTGLCLQHCPNGYFRSNITKTCVQTCTRGYFADSISKYCTLLCENGTYGDSLTRKCQRVCSLPNYADPTTRLCVAICPSGLYADNHTQSCVTSINCYSNFIGDPTTNRCIQNTHCPTSPYMFADLTNKICTTRCSNWGDTVTRLCVASCPWNPNTYVTWANSDTNQCVTRCPNFPIKYADNHTKSCVAVCPLAPTITHNSYADPTTQSCVDDCPNGYYADLNQSMCVTQCTIYPLIQFFDKTTGNCVSSCPQGFYSDLSLRKCVQFCSKSPQYYAYQFNNSCLHKCPNGTFGDNSTGKCVSFCPQSTKQFADSSINQCVDICPIQYDTFGQIGTDGYRRCLSTCSFGYFADPLTRLCVLECNISQGYYGQQDNPLRRCVIKCPTASINKYADNTTKKCVSQCPNIPTKTFGNPSNKMCENKCPNHLYGNHDNNLCVIPTNCPTAHYGDNFTRLCVRLCPANQQTFGQPTTRICVRVCPQNFYADRTTRLCSSTCNSIWNLYKDPSTKTCVMNCPSTPNLYADPFTMKCSERCTGGYFAYDITRRCIPICPSTPTYYGDYANMRCVLACPRQTFLFVNNTYRGCGVKCPQRVFSALYIVDLYADNSTWTCVAVCPVSKNLYNFKHPDDSTHRICVSTCPLVNSTFYFAQNITQSCVTTCPSLTYKTYGDIFTSKCVLNCSRNQYRDNTTKRCVYYCSPGYFADNTTWNCVQKCPSGLFAQSINQTCAKNCPTGYYADNQTNFCTSLCNATAYQYSDNTTWKCVPTCTNIPDFYADPNTKKCSKQCTGGLFADKQKRSCVPVINCSNSTVGDPLIYRCIQTCPISVPSFLDKNTSLCTTNCPPGFYGDNSTMLCVQQCPINPDYYALNHSLLNGVCVLYCPVSPIAYYRHNITRQCLQLCPEPYFRDQKTMRCVLICPAFFYAEVIDRICLINCSLNSKFAYQSQCYQICPNGTNADPTTFLCVQTCPNNYYSDNKVCNTSCTNGFADNFTKSCVDICTPDYYSKLPERKCVQNCQPHFKYFENQSCIQECPTSSNISLNLYRDTNTYSCLNKCLPTWYADNQTRTCRQVCSGNQFADNSTGLCVIKCPQTPDFFGWNNICYQPCPLRQPMLFAQNTTRTCQTICPNASYADNYTRRCVQKCTNLQYGYTDGVRPICVSKCIYPTYGHNETQKCIEKCPDSTFGQNTTRLCLNKCPSGTYGDIHLNLCVSTCNNSIPQFADPSSSMCVLQCPRIPSLYGDFEGDVQIPKCVPACFYPGNFTLNTTRRCVTWCPEPFFSDSITGDCAYTCKPKSGLYADNVTRSCTSCPNITINNQTIHTYADPSTMKCVFKCPQNPSLYGDNFTNTCVSRCPDNSYGDNDTRFCLKTCFFNHRINQRIKFTFADNLTNFCVYQCPQNSWADNYTIDCTSNCTIGTFADDSTWRCVAMCPSNPISYSYSITRKCIYACPSPYLASQVGRACRNGTCPTTPFYYFKDNIANQCVKSCVFPYFSQISTQSCVTECSYGFYQHLGSMSCTACPSECLTCFNSKNCTTCQPRLYSHLGLCLVNCPTFPIYYYKYNPSMICIEICPAPYFGFLLTGRCQNTCPSQFFTNTTANRCQACPTGCNSCLGTVCSTCITGYTFVLKYQSCSKRCSLTKHYFLSGSCSSNCTAGTFLIDDLVTCQKCNKQCAQCSNLATNCTKCSGKFWYNYNCVDNCPSNHYVDRFGSCQLCSNNPIACALPPLKYTLRRYMLNYQLNIEVIFNRQVVLTLKQFSKVVQLKTQKGPIKSSQYKLTKVSGSTFNMRFLKSSSLNQLSLSVSFTPGFITDGDGNPLTQSSADTQLPVIQSVSGQVQLQSQKLSGQVNLLSYFLIIILLILMIRSNYIIIILLDTLQLIHMHIYVIVAPLPYLYMHVISKLNNIHFTFLPTLYTNPDSKLDDPYINFQTDTSFLGNCHPFVFFFIIFTSIYLIFWGLSNKTINKFTNFRRKIKNIFRTRMRFSFLYEIFYYTEYYVLFFAIYQFTGKNSYMKDSATNLAAAVIVLILYMVWLLSLTYASLKNRYNLNKVPQKYKFVVLQKSRFAFQMPLRSLFKLMIVCALTIPEPTMQLLLMMVFNMVSIIYTFCYSPSVYKYTNYLNIFIHVGMIIYEIVLLLYQISDKNSQKQQSISLGLFAVIGVIMLIILFWIIYRIAVGIRQYCFGIKPEEIVEVQIKPQAKSHNKSQDYQKVIKISSSKKNIFNQKQKNTQKDMNISELNFKDQEDQQDDYDMNAEEVIKQFTYFHIPKKSQGVLKQQKALLGIKEKKRNQPLVIEIDEEQLIDYKDKNSRAIQSKESLRPKRIKGKGHLKIQENQKQSDIQSENFHNTNILKDLHESSKKIKKDQKNNKQDKNKNWSHLQISDISQS